MTRALKGGCWEQETEHCSVQRRFRVESNEGLDIKICNSCRDLRPPSTWVPHELGPPVNSGPPINLGPPQFGPPSTWVPPSTPQVPRQLGSPVNSGPPSNQFLRHACSLVSSFCRFGEPEWLFETNPRVSVFAQLRQKDASQLLLQSCQ